MHLPPSNSLSIMYCKALRVFALFFFDNIFIFSPDMESHKPHLLDIAIRLNAFGLTLNMDKTSLGLSHIEVLGYHLSADGILPLKDKVSAMKNFPLPTTVKSLRQFLGMVTYQRRFLQNPAQLLQPLNNLLQDKVKNNDLVAWNDAAIQAFIDIYRALSKISYLAHLKASAKLQLKCDASGLAIGAILEQVHEGKIEPLGYFSKALHGPQMKFSTYDLELLSVYSSVKYFEHLLLDKPFTILTHRRAS